MRDWDDGRARLGRYRFARKAVFTSVPRTACVSIRFGLSMEMSRLTWDGTAEPSRETKFSGANGDREIFIFPVQLTTSSIDTSSILV